MALFKNDNTSDTADQRDFIVSDSETGPTHSGAVKRNTEEIRQGHTGDHVRYILMVSTAIAVAVLFSIYFVFIA